MKEWGKEIMIQINDMQESKKKGLQNPRIRKHKSKGGVVERKGKRNKDTNTCKNQKKGATKSKDKKA